MERFCFKWRPHTFIDRVLHGPPFQTQCVLVVFLLLWLDIWPKVTQGGVDFVLVSITAGSLCGRGGSKQETLCQDQEAENLSLSHKHKESKLEMGLGKELPKTSLQWYASGKASSPKPLQTAPASNAWVQNAWFCGGTFKPLHHVTKTLQGQYHLQPCGLHGELK